jgi:hypothetical protein
MAMRCTQRKSGPQAKPSDKGVAVRDLTGNKPCNGNMLHGFSLRRDFLAAKSTLND